MRISELIKKLQEIQKEYGDIKTYYCGYDYHGDLDDYLFEDVFEYNKAGMLIIKGYGI